MKWTIIEGVMYTRSGSHFKDQSGRFYSEDYIAEMSRAYSQKGYPVYSG